MQLVAEISLPRHEEDRVLVLTSARLKKRREQGYPIDWYVMDAIELTYGRTKTPSIHKETFCEEWGISQDQFDSAIAKHQRKGNLHRPDTIVQLELFAFDEEGGTGR